MLPGNITSKKQRIRHKGKTRYSSKEYSNPFFSKKKKKRLKAFKLRLGWKAKAVLFGIFVLIVALVWAVFYSGYFNIKTITVIGGGRIDKPKVEAIADKQIGDNYLVLFPQKNLWLFSAKALKNSLEEKYAFNSLEINKKWPDELIVEYDEKDYALVWAEDDKYYYADTSGYIIEEANLLDIGEKEYPVFENRSGKKILSKQTSVDPETISYGLELFKSIRAYETDFKVARIIIDDEINTIKLGLVEGPEVYFNTKEAISKQIDKLLTVKRDKIANDFKNKTYIDVRYGNSVYYR